MRKQGLKKIKKLIELCFLNRLWGSAAELTYYLLFAFFPFLMFLVGAFSLIGGEEGSLIQQMAQWLPEQIQSLLSEYSIYLYSMPGSMPLFLGGAMTLYSLTRAFHVLGFHIRRIYGRTRRRKLWHDFRQSGIFTLVFMVLILLNFGLIVCGRFFLTLLERFTSITQGLLTVMEVGRFAVPMALGFFFVLHLYHFLPGGEFKLRQALPGTVFCMLAWGGATILFSFYMDRIARYSLLYGSVSAAVMLVVWLNLTSVLLLFGAQINVFLLPKEKPRNGKGSGEVTS